MFTLKRNLDKLLKKSTWTRWLTGLDNQTCLVWVLLTCLAKPIKKDSINLQKTLMLISMQKIYFILVILSTLSMPAHTHQIWKYQFVENFYVHLHKKTNFISHYILEILQRFCKPVILDPFGMTGHPHQNWKYHFVWKFQVHLHVKNQLHLSLLFWGIAKIFHTCYFADFRHA